MAFTELASTKMMRLCRQDSLLVGVFTGTVGVKDLDILSQCEHQVARESGHVVLITLIKKVADEVKNKGAEIMRSIGPKMKGSATVLLNKGIGATILRTFMTGFALFSKSSVPQKVFSSVEEALTWLKTLSPDIAKVRPDDITDVFAAEIKRTAA